MRKHFCHHIGLLFFRVEIDISTYQHDKKIVFTALHPFNKIIASKRVDQLLNSITFLYKKHPRYFKTFIEDRNLIYIQMNRLNS